MNAFLRNIWVVLLLFPLCLQAQNQKLTVSGYIKDVKNGEGLIGASVFVKELMTGTTTNTYGFYSLTVPKGNYTLVVSSVGYRKSIREIKLTEQSLSLNLELQEDGQELEEVVVKAKREDDNVKSMEMSVNKVEMKTIKKIPALLGEVDLVRAIQFLPGVTTVGEGASGFNVRGGGVDQNLILLDDAPVYNSSHLFGFFSVFNPDAVKDVKLIKGGVPAQYGGRASSILDVKMKEGNAKELEINGGIGVIFSRLSIEAPIVKDKASFIVAARRSYIDILAKPFLTGNNAGSSFNFYDLTAKVNYNIDNKNTVFLSGYFGRDVFGQDFGFNWGNSTLSGRWNHVFSDKLFLNTTAFYSNYDYALDSDLKNKRPNNAFKWSSNITNLSIKPDFTYYISPNNTLTFGGQVLTYNFKPGAATATSEGESRSFGQERKNGIESSIYVGDEWKISPKFSVQYGLRFSRYDYSSQEDFYYQRKYVGVSADFPSGYDLTYIPNTKGKTIQTYQNLEPRFSMNYNTGDNSSIKASYNRLAQYVHLMSNTAASTPLDVWTSSTNNIKPQVADQVALGYFQNFGDNMYEASAEVFYKEMQNQIDYADRANLFLNPYFEKDLLFGKGRAYGLELFVKKNRGKLTGWISYTLQRSEKKIDALNNGNWYFSRYDRTHTLNMLAQYEINKKWSFGANFAYITGVPYTLPEQQFVVEGQVYPYIPAGTRGNFRVPAYHRLDVSATKKNKKALFGKGESEWVFSIYNLYNRRNPFSIYTRPNETNPAQTEAVQLSIIGSFVPAVTYNFKF
ncbi:MULTISPECIES: TonB-dependent receptor [Flectobacillus]|uniref:TonB-dependent receptor n=1 Tax=Flectobacillus rivi TaxID=2984209 RepID=A0ABT6YY17_9BACT|nr:MULTISPECIES: TonB-dependent receptor [Flectobacillus]MDI9873592.1 TonB-dependent receptor [Flectobacillus rivi]MDI9878617.1 TonB-dependent receptor [Flectobacillus longus]